MDPQPGSALPGEAPGSPLKDPMGNTGMMGAGATGMPTALDADGLPINPDGQEVKSNIPPETLEDMKALWDVFDMDATNHVPIRELRTIMRALDIDLKPEELEIVRKQIDPDSEGFIRFERLQAVMEEKLKDVDTYEDLIEQFKHLDREACGKIPNPLFKQYMMTMGRKMTLEEFDDLMKEADPKGEGMVDIEEFSQRLCPAKK